MRNLDTILAVIIVTLSNFGIAQGQTTLYWTDPQAGKFQRMNLDDGLTEDVLTATLRFPQDIVVDLEGVKMYWCSRGGGSSGSIRRANVDGSEIEDLVETASPFSLTIDAAARWLYWSGDGALQRIRLDGSAREVLVDDVYSPGLALDLAEGKMYWTSWGYGTQDGNIDRANLDGSGRERLMSHLQSPSGIELDPDRGLLYWADNWLGGSGVLKANLDGSENGVLVAADIVGSVAGHVALDDDHGTIVFTVEEWLQDNGGEYRVKRVYRYSLENHESEVIPIGDDRHPEGIDVAGDYLYWTDPVQGAIYRSNLDGGESVVLINSPLLDPRHVEVDPGAGKVFWAESSRIRRADIGGSNIENLVLTGAWSWPGAHEMITDFELDLRNRRMYWTTWNGWGPGHGGGIFSAAFDGSDIDTLFGGGTGAIALDVSAGKMYFTDSSNDGDFRIRQANLDGSSVIDWVPEASGAMAVDTLTGMLYYESEGIIWRGNDSMLVSEDAHLESLALDLQAEKMYWTEVDRDVENPSLTQSRIRRAKLDGSNVEDLVVATGSDLGGIFVLSSPSKGTAVMHENSADFNLGAAYPNPFNPSTTIQYSLAATEQISIKVRDGLGRLVAVLVDGAQPAGAHQVIWNASKDHPSGVYFYTLETGRGALARSMLLLK